MLRYHPAMTAADSSGLNYRGRFAPSPTGVLHFGSLVAAVGSYLEARAAGGEWLLRIEDVDEPRTAAGAADSILRTLERMGFAWDGEVVFQLRQRARTENGELPCGFRAAASFRRSIRLRL